jgi:TRAP-type mannitol/chloroaromatic compound transport system permease small subunit
MVCVRVYLIGYIFCIINYHIYQDIFVRIDIIYCRLSYVSRGALPLKTLVLYI